MKKLYHAKINVDVMFISDKVKFPLRQEAEHYSQEELRNLVPGRVVIKEIKAVSEIPESWREAHIWGDDEERTPIEYLKAVAKEKDPEYKEYLRLKKKFDGVDEDDDD